jgi:DNA-directed RNA polymerase specialized sigma24 family protein
VKKLARSGLLGLLLLFMGLISTSRASAHRIRAFARQALAQARSRRAMRNGATWEVTPPPGRISGDPEDLPRLIVRLPWWERHVLLAFYYDGRSFGEIAEQLQLEEALVRALLRAALSSLRQMARAGQVAISILALTGILGGGPAEALLP